MEEVREGLKGRVLWRYVSLDGNRLGLQGCVVRVM